MFKKIDSEQSEIQFFSQNYKVNLSKKLIASKARSNFFKLVNKWGIIFLKPNKARYNVLKN